MSDEKRPTHDHRLGHPGPERRVLADRRPGRARPSCTTTTSCRRCSTSTASACPSASSTPRAAARTASSRSPRTSRSSRRRTSSAGVGKRRRCSCASPPSPASRASRTRSATRAASRSSSTPRRATTTWSATTRRSSSSATPSKFQDFIHSQKRLPDTGLRDNDMQWDFWTLSPESAHQVTILMSDRGIPRTWRHQNGYCSHTYSWINAGGERFWVKYHFKTVQGIENFTEDEAGAMAGEDPDFHRRDLLPGDRRRATTRSGARDAGHAVRGGRGLPLQPVRPDQGLAARRLPADHGRAAGARPQPGELLRRGRAGRASTRPTSCPGIGLSPDKMLMGRIFSYHDTHLHRIGAELRAAADQRARRSPCTPTTRTGR